MCPRRFRQAAWLATAALLIPLAAGARVGLAGYVETHGFDKALLLANTGNQPVDLASGWRVAIHFNGARRAGEVIALHARLPPHGRLWLVNARADARLRAVAGQLTPNLNFNGNDAVVLLHGRRVADSIGRIGQDPGLAWSASGVDTRGQALLRRPGDIGSDRNPWDAFNPARQWRITTLGQMLERHQPLAARSAGQFTIPAIQGAGLLSPLTGDRVQGVSGVVTAVAADGFFMQAVPGDGNPDTSDGLFVYTHHRPQARPGERVVVSGAVREYRDRPADLTLTEISATRVRGTGRSPLPGPVLIGLGGRPPPTIFIFRGGTGRAIDRHPGRHLPADTGIAFMERLEGMRVRIERPQVVGRGVGKGRFWVVADAGRGATGMNSQGGITVRHTRRGTDRNPERVLVDCRWLSGRWPSPRLGQRFGSIVGVIGYHDGAYVLHATRVGAAAGRVRPAEPRPFKAGADTITLATYNVDNLGPGASVRLRQLGRQIANALGSPALIALQEIEDDSGRADDGVTAAGRTIARLVSAIREAGGPAYRSLSVAPANDADGGQPGANIRPVLLYNPEQLQPVVAGDGPARQAAEVMLRHGQALLAPNPARIDPNAEAFYHSRKPLVALFRHRGHRLLVVDVHLTARGGSDPDWGRFQPPRLAGARRRGDQLRRVAAFVTRVRGTAPTLPVVVMGDFNAMGFEAAVTPLLRAGLVGLGSRLAAVERFSYIFRGNGEELDHIFASPPLARGAMIRIMHLNSGRAHPASDHDPVLARLHWPRTPAVLH